tara:strand:+ start:284 stop:742 length:459 start_codon:yes stop_codon:yes gene_type:complete
MNPTDDTIGTPDFLQALLSLPEDKFASALGYDPEVFSWITGRMDYLLNHSIEIGKRVVFGSMKDDAIKFIIFPIGNEGTPEMVSYEGIDPSYFDSTIGLQLASGMAYFATCDVVEQFDGVVDLVLTQLFMGFIPFEEAKQFSSEESIRHMPA